MTVNAITLKMNVRTARVVAVTTLLFLRGTFGNVDVCHQRNDAGRAVSVICDSGVGYDDNRDVERGSRRIRRGGTWSAIFCSIVLYVVNI